ncbi:Transposable element Tc3 transposase, partial [Araneus ventricosus]
VQLAQWLASPLRNREVASSIPGCVSYSVFAIICNKFARQACGKLAASSFHGDFEAFVNLLQACTLVMTNLWQTCTLVMTNLWQTCTLVMTNLWQACCKLKLLSGN